MMSFRSFTTLTTSRRSVASLSLSSLVFSDSVNKGFTVIARKRGGQTLSSIEQVNHRLCPVADEVPPATVLSSAEGRSLFH